VVAVLAEGLVKSFGQTQALCGVDLQVERAQVLGLLGPNGAGKTTTVRILTTLLRPDAGRAVIDGIDVVADPRSARARIGLTGQYAAVDERLSGFENLEHVGRLFHLGVPEAKSRARELLERFSLQEAGDRVVKGYSGGMRRRLDIAMSLIARPSVLFLDEPTTGLDPRSRQDVWELIEELVRGGTTTLLTTQYLDEADRLADEVAVIDKGVVIARGTSRELKSRIGGDRIEVILESAADVSQAIPVLECEACGEVRLDGDDRTLLVPVADAGGMVPRIVRDLDAAKIPVSDVGVRRSTLDDVFFALTGHAAEEPNGTDGTDAEPGEAGQAGDATGSEPAAVTEGGDR
jgi:ABC-2 type transport system ATP-binding protein